MPTLNKVGMPEFPWDAVLEGVKMAQKSDFAGGNILCETRPLSGGLYSVRTPRGNNHLPKSSGTPLVKGVLVPFCTVETFFCRPGLMVRKTITEFSFIAIEKMEHQSSSEEVGVYNFQKPGDHNYYRVLHIRKISKGLCPQEVKEMVSKTYCLGKQKSWAEMDLDADSFFFSFYITCLVFVYLPFPLL